MLLVLPFPVGAKIFAGMIARRTQFELEQVELEVEGALGVRRAAGERRRGDLLAAPQQHQAQATFLVSPALVIPMPTNRGPARDVRGRHNESHGRGLVLGVFLWVCHGDPGVAWLAKVAVNLSRQVFCVRV